MAAACWKDVVKVNGSFYCNLSEEAVDLEEPPDETTNRTIVRVGDDETTSSHSHSIKLVIGGEPLSLDTSEYVSWDGSSSQAGGASPLPPPDSLDEEDDDDESPVVVVHPPLLPAEDELTHTCRQYFDHRQSKLVRPDDKGALLVSAGLQDKMEHLRREIVSAVDLFLEPLRGWTAVK